MTPQFVAHFRSSPPPPPRNSNLSAWVEKMATLTKPDRIVWCDGSEEEKRHLTEEGRSAVDSPPTQSA